MVQGTIISTLPLQPPFRKDHLALSSVRYIPLAWVDGLPQPSSISMWASAISGGTGFFILLG